MRLVLLCFGTVLVCFHTTHNYSSKLKKNGGYGAGMCYTDLSQIAMGTHRVGKKRIVRKFPSFLV